MFIAMERMEVDTKLTNLVASIYRNIVFKVEIDGHSPDWQAQHTAIRQGCPLSPYPFLIATIVIYHDVHQQADIYPTSRRVPGANFDEVAYADDTICITTATRAMSKFSEATNWEGFQYCSDFSTNTCEPTAAYGMWMYISRTNQNS